MWVDAPIVSSGGHLLLDTDHSADADAERFGNLVQAVALAQLALGLAGDLAVDPEGARAANSPRSGPMFPRVSAMRRRLGFSE